MNFSTDGGAGSTWTQGKLPLGVCRLLAGLETGLVGGAAMLAWVGMTGMFLDRQPFWLVTNLLASLFYGPSAVHRSFTTTTVSGLALHAFASAVVGMAFAFLIRDSKHRVRIALVGIMVALVWYQLSGILIWRRLGALAALYVSPGALLPGHLIYGLLLVRYPKTLKSVRAHFGWEPPHPIPVIAAGDQPRAASAPASDEPRPE